ncbi:MAG: MarR family transcriptional regulator [Candidatus Woesearchaeota archaeon]
MRREIVFENLVENEAYWKILYFYFAYPDKSFSISDLALELKIHKQTASKVVKQLAQEGFLTIEIIGRIWKITCKPNHSYNFSRKIAYNLQNIYQTNSISLIYEQIPHAKSIILFGSYRKGDDISSSDIDIAVEVIDDKGLEIYQLGVISQLGYRKNIPVNVHVFSRKNININLFNNIANGILLDGFLEVKP